jgi:hypothetical protein
MKDAIMREWTPQQFHDAAERARVHNVEAERVMEERSRERAEREARAKECQAKVLPLFGPTHQPTHEELADLFPWLLTGILNTLAQKDRRGQGRWFARELAEIASRTEALCIQWERERIREELGPA